MGQSLPTPAISGLSFPLAENNYNEYSATSKLFPLEIFPEDKFWYLEYWAKKNILMVLVTDYHTAPKMPSRNYRQTSLNEGNHFTLISPLLRNLPNIKLISLK